MRHLFLVIPIFVASTRVTTGYEYLVSNPHRSNRKLWYFDQDDLFLEHTTQVPTVAPTLSHAPTGNLHFTKQPSTTKQPNTRNPVGAPNAESPTAIHSAAPSHSPTTGPTMSPSTSRPTNVPTIYPSISPTQSSSLVPTQFPTSPPSSRASNFPTIAPVTLLPSNSMVTIEISPFVLKLISNDELSNILEKDIAHVAGIFLTDYLRSNLPKESGFQHVMISIETKSNGRRLDIENQLTFSGEADFHSETPPTTNELDEMVLSAFTGTSSNNEFLSLLIASSNNFSQVVKVEASGASQDKKEVDDTKEVVLIIIGIVCAALAVFLIHVHRRKRQEEHDLRYLAQINRDSDVNHLEPQPLTISSNRKALMRTIVRVNFDRAIMKEANAKLQTNQRVLTPKSNSIKFGPTTEIEDGSDSDEEGGYLSRIITSSFNTSKSSLWGENSSLQNSKSWDTESCSQDYIEKGDMIHQIPKLNVYECAESFSMTSPLGAEIVSPQYSESNMTYSSASENSDYYENTREEKDWKDSYFDRMMGRHDRSDTKDDGSEEGSEKMDDFSNQSPESDSASSEREHAKNKSSERKPDNNNYFTSVFTRRY